MSWALHGDWGVCEAPCSCNHGSEVVARSAVDPCCPFVGVRLADEWCLQGQAAWGKVWERLADRGANSLAASMEKYLVCFVS